MKNNLISLFCEMRSDFKDNTDTINKMIQFGTVKYGIVKQLKDRSRSDRDITSDQEENGSCSPIVNCKSSSPDIHRSNINSNIFNHSGSDEDHNHNNNLMSEDHNDSQIKIDQTYLPEIDRINSKFPSPTPPDLEINNQPLSRSPTIVRNEIRTQSDYDDEDQNMSEDEVGGVVEKQNEQDEEEIEGEREDEEEHQASELKLKTKTASEAIRQSAEDQLAKINETAVANANASNGDRNGSPPLQMPQFPPGPVTLEAIQNMQMAIAQFAAKTIANGGTGADNEAAMKQLAFLQQTLFNLQQQQLFQIQLIQQLQSQIAMNQIKHDGGEGDDEEDEECDEEDEGRENQIERDDEMNDHDAVASVPLSLSRPQRPASLSSNQKSSELLLESNHNNTDRMDLSNKLESSLTESLKRKREDRDLIDEYEHSRRNSQENRISQKDASMMTLASKQDENMPLPYGSDLASSIITNHDDLPSLDEPNSLEMLQKRAQEVLDSASQGILANNLADEFAFGKDKSVDGKNRNEPFFKHRCRYCGKVFGSDSALQIHIRSHTGERPFKCNVCGSRFTTKGNLKVHFQRHAQKFPHIPMNATPIPEHLDKFHPPLLEQMSPDSSPTHQPQMPHLPNLSSSLPLPFPPGSGFPGLPGLYRPPMDLLKALGPYPNPFFGSMPQMPPVTASSSTLATPLIPTTIENDDEMPTDLRKPSAPSSPEKDEPIKEETEETEEPLSLRIKEEKLDEVDECDEEAVTLASPKSKSPSPSPIPIPPQASERFSPVSQEPEMRPSPQPTPPTSNPSTTPVPGPNMPPVVQPQQPPISRPPLSPSTMSHQNFDLMPLPGQLPPLLPHLRDDFLHDRFPLKFQRTSPERRSPICSPASIPRSPFFGPIKHEMALLPRPHSNDNSWENFIEVSNTSETLKLKELMKNKKLTDPNQCVVCDRVLSCKSALQMHYRTHTGERPFRCRICGRAFTTKGNLKTHMAVHKIRPPMRNFHQCPVCHKKYSNALVLQQHIRLHTGEPTDLTPEQIQAAEIRDPPPSMMHGSFLNPFAFHFGMGGPMHNGNGMGSESSQGDMDDNMDCSDGFDDDISDHNSNYGDSDRPKSGDEMKGMLFDQKLKIDNYRPKSRNSINSAPTSPISILNKSSPVPSEVSQGALDLTPRAPPSAVAQPAPAIKASTPSSPTSPSNHSKLQQQQQQQQQHHHHHQQQLKLQQQQQQLHQEQQQRQQEQLRHHELQQRQLQHHHQQQQQLQQQHHLQSNSALMAARPPFGMFPNIPLFPPSTTQNMCSAMNSIAQSVMPAAPFNPLALSGVRGSTTCGICFKTFPCHSALEIHYRSHTKERPFKCETCERGFTTKGNLKQHMLTHKIRDMEQETYKNRAVKFEYMSGWKKDFD